MSYILKDDYRLSPTQSSFFDVSNKVPWMLKPIWGSLSDNFLLFGYKRKSYIMVMAIGAWLCLLNFGLWLPPIVMSFVLLLLFNVSLSFVSCMAQAVLVENAQEQNRRKDLTEEGKTNIASRGVSTYFGARYIGNILGSLCIMFLFNENKKSRISILDKLCPNGSPCRYPSSFRSAGKQLGVRSPSTDQSFRNSWFDADVPMDRL